MAIDRMREACTALAALLCVAGLSWSGTGAAIAADATGRSAGRIVVARAGPLPAAVVERRLAEIDALERRRFAAMVAMDTKLLEPMLSDRLRYCHSNGICEGKSQFLEALASAQLRYHAIKVLQLEPRIVGTVIVVHGRAAITGEARGEVLESEVVFTDVYEPTPAGWQLVAWQSTRQP